LRPFNKKDQRAFNSKPGLWASWAEDSANMATPSAARRCSTAEKKNPKWQATWQPLAFSLSHVYLIWRNDPPDDVFRTDPVLSLGGQ